MEPFQSTTSSALPRPPLTDQSEGWKGLTQDVSGSLGSDTLDGSVPTRTTVEDPTPRSISPRPSAVIVVQQPPSNFPVTSMAEHQDDQEAPSSPPPPSSSSQMSLISSSDEIPDPQTQNPRNAAREFNGLELPLAHLEAVIRGSALPNTKQEARAASAHRLERLCAHFVPANVAPTDHQLMPEFFFATHFPMPDPVRGCQVVRCVCGAMQDDGVAMIACDADNCGVWQHLDCVGAAAPRNLVRGRYRCHVCDPFAHRVVIRIVRRVRALWGDTGLAQEQGWGA